MTRIKRLLALSIIIVLAMAFPFSANAATNKSVYVVTKINAADYSEEDVSFSVIKFTYDKKGLLKKSNLNYEDGLVKAKTTYVYGNKSKIKSGKATWYLLGEKYDVTSKKYTVNKKGYVTRIREYNSKGKLTGSQKFTINSKGICTKAKDYNAKGKLIETRSYTISKNGKVSVRKTYSAKGKLKSTEKFNYSSNSCIIEKYNSNGKLIETCVEKYKNGNKISQMTYDETKGHKLVSKSTASYKKITTTNKAMVKAQQFDIGVIIL